MTAASAAPNRLLLRVARYWRREIARVVGVPVAFSISIAPAGRERRWHRRMRPGDALVWAAGFDSQPFDLLAGGREVAGDDGA